MFSSVTLVPLDTILPFFGASAVLAITPGPDIIFVLTQSVLYGARAGIITTLGLITGLCWHTLAVALGVAALFQASPTAFTGLKIVGAVYLLYLAWLTWRSNATTAQIHEESFLGFGALYRRGIIMNATNPKVTLFFLAFLPQFADPARGSLPWQMVQLGIWFAVATALVFGIVALISGRIATWFTKGSRSQAYVNKTVALIFIALAVSLLVT